MEPGESTELSVGESTNATPVLAGSSVSSRPSSKVISSHADAGACATCGSRLGVRLDDGVTYPYVYAIGRVQHSFATVGDEKEYAQATGRADAKGLTDQQVLHQALRENRYLARRGCFVLTIEGLETYILQARDPMDLDLLVDAVRPKPSPMDLNVVVGLRGPIAPPEMCNGLMVPIVFFDQLYSFDREALQKDIPRPKNIPQAQFLDTVSALLDRILQTAPFRVDLAVSGSSTAVNVGITFGALLGSALLDGSGVRSTALAGGLLTLAALALAALDRPRPITRRR